TPVNTSIVKVVLSFRLAEGVMVAVLPSADKATDAPTGAPAWSSRTLPVLIVAGSAAFENVTVAVVVIGTPVAPLAGDADTTLIAVLSRTIVATVTVWPLVVSEMPVCLPSPPEFGSEIATVAVPSGTLLKVYTPWLLV